MVDAFGADGYLDSIKDIRLDLLDMFGKSYVVEYSIAFFKRRQEERKYLDYFADALSVLTENTARVAGGRYIKRLSEIEKPEEKRTASEIKEHIKGMLRALEE